MYAGIQQMHAEKKLSLEEKLVEKVPKFIMLVAAFIVGTFLYIKIDSLINNGSNDNSNS
jgi:hypothetical protein